MIHTSKTKVLQTRLYLRHDCPERLLAAEVGLVEGHGLSGQLLHPDQALGHVAP